MKSRRVFLGDFVEKNEIDIQTGPFGTQLRASDYTSDGTPVINVRNIGYGTLRPEKLEYVPDSVVDRLGKHILSVDDIVFGRKGAVDRHILVDDSQAGWMQGSDCIRIRVESKALSPEYLSRVFCLDSHKRWMLTQCSNKATMASLNQDVICRIPIILPDPGVQREIVRILSAYDDLIENNRRRIQLLEQAARLLYKEWFVHLRFPGHEHVKITDGVPEGWVRKSLSEIAEFRLGKMLDQQKNRGDLMPYLANVNVRWGEFDFDGLREMRFEQHELDRFGLKYGDIVMCEGGEPGRCAIWKEQIPGMMIQKAIHRIRPHQDLDHRFLYYSLLHQGKSGRLARLFTGATIKHLPREKLAKVEIEIPPKRLTSLFLEHVRPIENQLDLLQTGIKRASEARDLLLPRLMNGEIPV